MKKHDNTVPIAIAITITMLIIVGIVLGTTCKDKFANLKKNVGLFSNVQTEKNSGDFADAMFNKWRAKVGGEVSMEEAKERWNKVISGYSDFLTKPIEQLSQEQQNHRKLIEERIPPNELKRAVTNLARSAK